MQLKDLVAFSAILLSKPSLLRQIDNNLEEYAQALNSIAEINSPAITLNDVSKWGIFI